MLDVRHLSSNQTHSVFIVVYDRQRGLWQPDFLRFDSTRPNWHVVQNDSIVFAMRVSVTTHPPPPPPPPRNQLQYLT